MLNPSNFCIYVSETEPLKLSSIDSYEFLLSFFFQANFVGHPGFNLVKHLFLHEARFKTSKYFTQNPFVHPESKSSDNWDLLIQVHENSLATIVFVIRFIPSH
jgi:hypothetical protein